MTVTMKVQKWIGLDDKLIGEIKGKIIDEGEHLYKIKWEGGAVSWVKKDDKRITIDT